MSVSDEATPKKNFGGSKPSSKLTLKTKWYHSCGCCDDCQSCEKLKKHVSDENFEKKVRLWTLVTFRYRKCMLLLQYLSDWCLHEYMFDRNPGGKTSQIEWLFESNLMSFGYLKCFIALWLLLDPSCKGQLAYKNWLGASGPDCHLRFKIGHLQKTEVAFKS